MEGRVTAGCGMELREKVEAAVRLLRPRLEDLSEGYAEVMAVDEITGKVTLRLFGGRLH